MSSRKFFIYTQGGLGDTIRKYFNGQEEWQYLPALKKKFPDVKIKLIIMSHNPQAIEFFRYHPLIDEIVCGPWEDPNIEETAAGLYAGDYQQLQGNSILDGLEAATCNKVYLNEKDKDFVSQITEGSKFIVLHPFASQQRKIVFPIKEYFPLVDELIDDLGFNVIIIGANWTSTKKQNQRHLSEQFPYDRDGVINLINKTNSRTAIRLVQKAEGLISVRSFCFSSTISGNIKATLLVGGSYLGVPATIQNLNNWGWPTLDKIQVIGINKKSDLAATRTKILNFHKGLVDHKEPAMLRFYGQGDPPVDQTLYESYFKDTRNGVFVECGAKDGVAQSSCKFFEESMGWSGVNIEPVPFFFEQLCKNRPHSTNLNIALSNQTGVATFTQAIHPKRGWNFGNGSLKHTEEHLRQLKRIRCKFESFEVATMTFRRLIKNTGLSQIDLFVLDVEGHEVEVIKSMKNITVWPRVMCVEHNNQASVIDNILHSYGYKLDRRVRNNSYYLR